MPTPTPLWSALLLAACSGAVRDTDPADTDPADTDTDPAPVPRVVVNEILASNDTAHAWLDGAEENFDDYVELYNAGDVEVDLFDWGVNDDEDPGGAWRFPEGTTLAPGAHLLLWASDGGPDAPGYHADFGISAGGEVISLFTPDDVLVDQKAFGAQTTDVALFRSPDGSETWVTGAVSPGAPNP